MTHLLKWKAVLLSLSLMFCFGCKEPKPLPEWTVKLVRPDGIVHKTWTVHSRTEPKGMPLWGGQIELYCDNHSGQSLSLGLMAPTGWTFDCEQAQ